MYNSNHCLTLQFSWCQYAFCGCQYLDAEDFRGDSAIWRRRLFHWEQGLHWDGRRWFIYKRFLGVRPCCQYLDTEGRFRGDSARCCRRLLHREQGLHWDGIRWFRYKRLLGVRPCCQCLDREDSFRGDRAIWRRRLLHREQGLHRDGIQRRFIRKYKRLLGV